MDESVFLNALKETFQHMREKLNYFCLSIRIVRAHTKDIVLQNRCVTWDSYSGAFYIQGTNIRNKELIKEQQMSFEQMDLMSSRGGY